MIAARIAATGRGLLYLALVSLAVMRPPLRIASLQAIPTDAIAALAGLCWGVAALIDARYRRWDRMFALLIVYFATMVVAALFAAPRFGHFAARLAGEAYLLGMPVLVLGLLEDERHLRHACRAWLVGTGLAVALLAVALAVAAIDPHRPWLAMVQHRFGSLPLGPFVRYRLAYDNPNMLGAYLTASLALVLLAAERRWIGRVAAVVLVAGIAMALIATFSAGIGGGLLLGAIWFWLKRRGTRPWPARAALAAGIACALAFVLAQALTPVGYPDAAFAVPLPGTSTVLMPASRLQTWMGAWRTFVAHPLTGIGMGEPVAHVRFVEPNGSTHLLTDGHDVLLDLAAECGIPGALAIAAIVAMIWRRTRPLRLDAQGAIVPAVAIGLGVLDVLAYQGIGGGFENARFVWLLIGLLLVAARVRGQRETVAISAV